MNPADESATQRLFAAIVLMGTSLTLGCGGISQREPQVDDGGSSNGGSSNGGSSNRGGGSSAGLGGMSLLPDNTIMLGASGAPPVAVTPGPFSCPPPRWSCSNPKCGLVADGWALPDDCACDPGRPEQASDCAAGQVFLCRDGTSTSDGHPLTEHVAFECNCVDKSMFSCHDECQTAYGIPDASCYERADEAGAVCGCAIIILK